MEEPQHLFLTGYDEGLLHYLEMAGGRKKNVRQEIARTFGIQPLLLCLRASATSATGVVSLRIALCAANSQQGRIVGEMQKPSKINV